MPHTQAQRKSEKSAANLETLIEELKKLERNASPRDREQVVSDLLATLVEAHIATTDLLGRILTAQKASTNAIGALRKALEQANSVE